MSKIIIEILTDTGLTTGKRMVFEELPDGIATIVYNKLYNLLLKE